MHLRLGQATWHNAQKHRVICRVAADFMLNLIPVPKLVPAYARPAKLPRTIDRITRATPAREKPMLFPANFNFKAVVVDVAKLVDRHGVHPMELTGVAASAAEPGFFSRRLDKLMEYRRARNATARMYLRPSARQRTAFLSWRWLDRATCLLKLTSKIAFRQRAWQ